MTQRNLPDLTLQPVTRAKGSVELPGSKSISNRVLLLAALSKGDTEIHGLLDSDDTRVMLDALKKLGVELEHRGESSLLVRSQGFFQSQQADLFLGNAGTAFRSMTAALAFSGGSYTLSGVARMHERPIGDLVLALKELGAKISYLGQEGYPPLQIEPALARGGLVRVSGSVSSQFLTALLLASPLFVAQSGQDLVIEVVGTLISKPYIDITLNLMRRFGVHVQRQLDSQGQLRFLIAQNALYRSPGQIHVEGDASSASYVMALGLIGEGPVQVIGVGQDSIQGDMAFLSTLNAMGADIQMTSNSVTISGLSVSRGQKLRAFDEDFNLIPDAAMTAAVLAIYADGPCRLRNIASWRVKETDRIHAMATELGKLGAQVRSGPDWLEVEPIAPQQWRSASIHTYDDHRMAMCFSLAAFGPVAVTIQDPGCVAKTYPDYFEHYGKLVA